MKIIISCGTMMQGGAERVISILSEKFSDMGHNVELLLYFEKPQFYKLDERVRVTVDEKVIGNKNVLRHIAWRRSFIKKSKPDVVISFLAPINMVDIIAMLGFKTKHIVADRSDPRRSPEEFIIRCARDFLYHFGDGIVLQNNRNREYFPYAIRKKSKIIYNPLDLGEYMGCGLNSEKEKKIVCVGRIIDSKRPEMLIRAFRKICNEFPQYKLVFLGDGNKKTEMEEYANTLGLAEKVEFCGAVENVFEQIKSAALFVLCSDYEGMPNSLLEAMCIGIPVISTRVSGATDVITHGENGILIECSDEEALADAMMRMLSDDDLRRKCSENAVKLCEKLNCDKIAKQWLDFIETVS